MHYILYKQQIFCKCFHSKRKKLMLSNSCTLNENWWKQFCFRKRFVITHFMTNRKLSKKEKKYNNFQFLSRLIMLLSTINASTVFPLFFVGKSFVSVLVKRGKAPCFSVPVQIMLLQKQLPNKKQRVSLNFFFLLVKVKNEKRKSINMINQLNKKFFPCIVYLMLSIC